MASTSVLSQLFAPGSAVRGHLLSGGGGRGPSGAAWAGVETLALPGGAARARALALSPERTLGPVVLGRAWTAGWFHEGLLGLSAPASFSSSASREEDVGDAGAASSSSSSSSSSVREGAFAFADGELVLVLPYKRPRPRVVVLRAGPGAGAGWEVGLFDAAAAAGLGRWVRGFVAAPEGRRGAHPEDDDDGDEQNPASDGEDADPHDEDDDNLDPDNSHFATSEERALQSFRFTLSRWWMRPRAAIWRLRLPLRVGGGAWARAGRPVLCVRKPVPEHLRLAVVRGLARRARLPATTPVPAPTPAAPAPPDPEVSISACSDAAPAPAAPRRSAPAAQDTSAPAAPPAWKKRKKRKRR